MALGERVAGRYRRRLQQQPAKDHGGHKRGKPAAMAVTMGLQRRHQWPNQGNEYQAQGKYWHAGIDSFMRGIARLAKPQAAHASCVARCGCTCADGAESTAIAQARGAVVGYTRLHVSTIRHREYPYFTA